MNRLATARWCRRAIAATALVAAVAAPAAGAQVAAITAPGSGTLTICRDWLVYKACDTYHHVALPAHIAVGDQIKLIFGSSDKEYIFRVVGIHRRGGLCTIRSPHTGPHDSGERLVVRHCKPAATAAVRQ
jgi:hypothetical protein